MNENELDILADLTTALARVRDAMKEKDTEIERLRAGLKDAVDVLERTGGGDYYSSLLSRLRPLIVAKVGTAQPVNDPELHELHDVWKEER